jgi:hypothetical protein
MNEVVDQDINWFLWIWLTALSLLVISVIYCIHNRKRARRSRFQEDFSTNSYERTAALSKEPSTSGNEQPDLFKNYLHGFWHKKSSELLNFQDAGISAQNEAFKQIVRRQEAKAQNTANFFLWDDGLIFCGFKLQGADLRSANLYGAYLRDMLLRDRALGGGEIPLVLRDTENYAAVDMSNTFLRNNILCGSSGSNAADLARTDLSGLYLRDLGLQGINIEKIMQAENKGFGDYFLPESLRTTDEE